MQSNGELGRIDNDCGASRGDDHIFGKTVAMEFDAAVARVTQSLATEGFGVHGGAARAAHGRARARAGVSQRRDVVLHHAKLTMGTRRLTGFTL
jgi:hypothetical protein